MDHFKRRQCVRFRILLAEMEYSDNNSAVFSIMSAVTLNIIENTGELLFVVS